MTNYFTKVATSTARGVMPNNTPRTPIVACDPLVTVDRRGQWCKCGSCGIIAVCRPTFDFYAFDLWKVCPLTCERCFRAKLQSEGTNTSGMPPMSTPEVEQ